MATRSILDADMATLAGWIRTGFGWWIEELRTIMPFAFTERDKMIGNFFLYQSDGKLEVFGTGQPQALLIDPSICLVRNIQLPVLGDADLARVVALDADRILPIPADQLIIGVFADPKERTSVTVAGFQRDTMAKLLNRAKAEGREIPERIGLFDPAAPGRIRVDFSSACAATGITAATRPIAMGWWAIAGFLFALNIGALIWRDVNSVQNMEALVSAQEPAVNAARTISKRIYNTQRTVQTLANLRADQNVFFVLSTITQALPEQAWVQRFSWDGRTIRLSGYKREGTDVVGALRKSPNLKNVRAANAEAMAEVPTGQPYDLTATFQRSVE